MPNIDLQSNGAIAYVVHHDLDLHFQAHKCSMKVISHMKSHMKVITFIEVCIYHQMWSLQIAYFVVYPVTINVGRHTQVNTKSKKDFSRSYLKGIFQVVQLYDIQNKFVFSRLQNCSCHSLSSLRCCERKFQADGPAMLNDHDHGIWKQMKDSQHEKADNSCFKLSILQQRRLLWIKCLLFILLQVAARRREEPQKTSIKATITGVKKHNNSDE